MTLCYKLTFGSVNRNYVAFCRIALNLGYCAGKNPGMETAQAFFLASLEYDGWVLWHYASVFMGLRSCFGAGSSTVTSS